MRAVGSVDVEGTAPMARDSVFRIASITKPIVAAAVMMLVEEGRIALDEPVGGGCRSWPRRRWSARPPVRSTTWCPADRPITVFDLLTFRAGYGFPSDFSLPAVAPLFTCSRAAASRSASRRRTSGWPTLARSRC